MRYCVDLQSGLMRNRYYSLLPQEETSLLVINCLILVGIAAFLLVVPLLQLILALLYLKYGHAWSRVLVREVTVFPWNKVLIEENY